MRSLFCVSKTAQFSSIFYLSPNLLPSPLPLHCRSSKRIIYHPPIFRHQSARQSTHSFWSTVVSLEGEDRHRRHHDRSTSLVCAADTHVRRHTCARAHDIGAFLAITLAPVPALESGREGRFPTSRSKR